MLKQIHKLCKPSYVYLVLSAITIILMMVQNAGASGTYKVGMYQCPCNNTAGIFLGKAIYVAFWTFILDAVCKAGYKSVSWFLVLFPMILGAVLVGLVLMSGGIREGYNVDDPWADDIDDALYEELLKAGNNKRQATPLHAERNGLRKAYARTMLDERLSDEPEGNKLIMFFQSFFEKLVNFLTGKGFQNETEEEERRLSQTERSRKLLEIKKQQEKAPKSEIEDKLDKMVADPTAEIKVDRKGDLLTSTYDDVNQKLRRLEEEAMYKEELKPIENSGNGGINRSNEKNTSVNFPEGDKMNSFEYIPTRRWWRFSHVLDQLPKQKQKEEGEEDPDENPAGEIYDAPGPIPASKNDLQSQHEVIQGGQKSETANDVKTTQHDDTEREEDYDHGER
jgi:hypothetical protein